MSWSRMTSITVWTLPFEKLSGPHQLTSMAPAPLSAIQRAWRSRAARSAELYGPSAGT